MNDDSRNNRNDADNATPEARRRAEAEAAKAEAEAEKVRLETQYLKEQERRNAELHKIQLDNSILVANNAQINLDINQIHANRLRREEARYLADDSYHRVYLFDTPVNHNSVVACLKQLSEWSRITQGPPCDMEIVFNSPGGSVIDGMHLFDQLCALRHKGHHITTTAMGMAASMAGILLQAGDVRLMGRESYLLIHQIAFMAAGKMGEVEDEVAFSKKIQGRILNIFAERSANTLVARGDTRSIDTLRRSRHAFFERAWNRKDCWLDSAEALKEGVIDEIIAL